MWDVGVCPRLVARLVGEVWHARVPGERFGCPSILDPGGLPAWLSDNWMDFYFTVRDPLLDFAQGVKGFIKRAWEKRVFFFFLKDANGISVLLRM